MRLKDKILKPRYSQTFVYEQVVERFVGRRRSFERNVGGNNIENVDMSNDKQIKNICRRKSPGFQQEGKLC